MGVGVSDGVSLVGAIVPFVGVVVGSSLVAIVAFVGVVVGSSLVGFVGAVVGGGHNLFRSSFEETFSGFEMTWTTPLLAGMSASTISTPPTETRPSSTETDNLQ